MRILDPETLKAVPKGPQTQAALNDQLYDLVFVAQRLGLYDAADFLKDKAVLR